MISFFEANLEQLIVHHVGNGAFDEGIKFSDSPLDLSDESLTAILKHYCLSPFTKATQVFNLTHPSGQVENNPIWRIASLIFQNQSSFPNHSRVLADYLYSTTNHPKIKGGEFYVAYFKNVQIEGDLHDVLGLFKSETKDTYLKLFPNQGSYGIDYEREGININKLDKGCLIFNTDKESGYKVVIVDQAKTDKTSAIYWKDQFLELKVRNDSHTQTTNIMHVFKGYVDGGIDMEFDVAQTEKAQLLNDAVKYFKERELFDFPEFSNVVFGSQEAIIESFTNYKDNYASEFEVQIPETFEISDKAVKSNLKAFKSVLKLDKNFHIYVHGNSELIQQGYDEEYGMNYYKVYFKEQS